MIEVGSNVKFNGAVSTLGTGTFSTSVNEFFIDGQWKRFIEPKVVEISTTDYDNHLTSSELNFISTALERLQNNITFDEHEKEVAESIVKKLKS